MDCPQCKGYQLEPSELEVGLIACRCAKCEGALLPLMNYRYWNDNNLNVESEPSTTTMVEDNTQAKLCPKCQRMMTKFKISAESGNKIELCTGCDEAWLDKGEWQLLKSLDVQNKLPSIFTDAWQRNIRLKQQEKSLNSHYEEKLGTEAFEKICNFKEWMEKQPDRGEIIQYLITKVQ
ncbi:hypothetical protein [Teredinibacter sp. KSP-S5-2]|uniref:TFIIB-type zinc ribbon-containing protein n=1 Tax=Teredinibacter sp. KSP-S5-2 TaxID=3034506 RepID=UPI002934AC3E|nr:hypothetical protein [Teredinibacter sp. KSP-S5-2]WNO09141.1 hypothetical protein P5V12_19555 [Teredinibacter sp. KSP-S5-2]